MAKKPPYTLLSPKIEHLGYEKVEMISKKI
jgi:hypothetical protein